MKRLRLLLSLFTVAAFTGGVFASAPASARATTQTIHVTDVTQAHRDVNPCSGVRGTFTMTYSGVFHSTELPNGTSWFTGTLHGLVWFVPKQSSQPSYAGKFKRGRPGTT